MTDLTNTPTIICPRGTSGLEPIRLDMAIISEAEGRHHEMGFVTPQKAPELLTLFNKAWLRAMEYYVAVKLELAEAQNELNRVTAIIILDKAPDLLASRGFKTSSKDLRDAICALDDNFEKATTKVCTIEAIAELLKIKAEFLENAYTGTKKILGEGVYDHRNQNLSGDTGTGEAGQRNPDGYGRSKF
jgi:hypothetical protein